jgi:hypothetical protein
LRTPKLGARAFIAAAISVAVILPAAPPPTVEAASAPVTEATQIISIAKQQLGKRWRYGAMGPRAFDCSGLVIYAYRAAGDGAMLGRLRGGRAMYQYFARRGMTSRTHPQPGDIVVWGGGSHVGLYIGGGMAISTLTRGVRIHRVHAVTKRFTAYIHTGMNRKLAFPVPAAPPAPAPVAPAPVAPAPVAPAPVAPAPVVPVPVAPPPASPAPVG